MSLLTGSLISLRVIWVWTQRLIVGACVAVFLLILVTLLFPDSILRWSAEAWSVAEKPEKGDAIFVLGGGNGFRPQATADLWREGYGDTIYVFRAKDPDSEEKSERRAGETVRILRARGVPAASIRMVEETVSSTNEEAVAAAQVIRIEGYSKVLIPTHLFHTRRAKWIFSQYTDCELIVTEAPYVHFRAEDWWKNEWGLTQFPNEIAKTVLYWMQY